MNIKDIQNLWETDSEIDSNALDTEALGVPKLYTKYMKLQNDVAYEISVIESAIAKKIVERTKYYKGWCDRPYNKKIVNAGDLKIFLDGDSEIITLRMKKSNANLRFKTLDRILKQIEFRGHHIRTAIDFRKFTEGQ